MSISGNDKQNNSESQIAESEVKYKMIFENSIDAILLTSPDGTISAANPAACRMFGLSEQEIISKGRAGLADNTYPGLAKAVEERERTGKFFGELRMKRGDGSVFPAEVSTSIFAAENGGKYTCMILRDITERKAAEEKHQKIMREMHQYASVFENAKWGIVISSIDGKNIMMMNPEFARMHGFAREELLGTSLWDLFPPEARPDLTENMMKVVDLGHHEFESLHIRKDGSVFPVYISSAAVKDENGNKIFRAATVFDITQRKKYEDELKKSELSYRTLTENSTDYVMRYDRECRHTYMNKAGLEVSGFSESDIIGKTHQEAGFPEDLSKVWEERIMRVFETGESDMWEFEWESAQGKKVLDWRLMPEKDERGNIYSVLGISRDITEMISREEKIKAALKEKEVLLKEIHHRVKNNLQIVSSLLSLQSDMVTCDNYLEAFKDSFNRIRSMAIIHEKLYQSNNFASIDFTEYAGQLINYLRITYNITSGKVKTSIEFDTVFLSIDMAIPLGLILNELISNAFKYAFSNDREGVLTCMLKSQPGLLTVTVKDNGPGLKINNELTGIETLGLTMVKSFVTQLKGNLEISNDNGAVFIITIPLP